MPKLSPDAVPSYRLHKQSGQAIVTLCGKDFLLGQHGSPQSRSEYNRRVAEWLTHGRQLPASAMTPSAVGGGLSVNELILAYWTHAKAYYRKDGRPTSELDLLRQAHRRVKDLYGTTPAGDFGPLALKAVRQKMIDQGLSRKVVNKHVDRVRRMFKWAAGNELVPAGLYHGLCAVEGLRKGRCEARETEPVRPVCDAHVDPVIRVLSPSLAQLIDLRARIDAGKMAGTEEKVRAEAEIARLAALVPAESPVAAMIQLQRLGGPRPGELVLMRACDLEVGGTIWTYSPSRHKGEHHGRERPIRFGPRAQEILRPFLTTDVAAFLFGPRAAVNARRLQLRLRRRSKVQPSQVDRSQPNPRWRPGLRYTVASYRRAVYYACLKANVPHWHPNQLRHAAATKIRRLYGLDCARAVLGHTSVEVTQVYAELDERKAEEVMAHVG